MGRLSDLMRAATGKVALAVIDRAMGAGRRLSDLADAVRPALGAAGDPAPPPIEIVPTVDATPAPVEARRAASAPPPPAAEASPPRPAPAPTEPPAPPTRTAPVRTAEDVRWALARHITAQLEVRRAAILDAQPWTPNGGHDPEVVRQMRVASRRLRTFAEVFGPRLRPKLRRRLRRALRRLTRALGPVRDWDVLHDALAGHLQGATGSEAAAIEHILVDVTQQGAAARTDARRQLAKLDAPRLRRDLDRALGAVVSPLLQERVDPRTEAWTLLRPPLQRALQRIEEAREHVDPERVHDIRIVAKRLRYAYDLLGPAFDNARRARAPLKQAQRVIGEARERQLLVDFVEGHRSRLHDQGRPHLASGLLPLLATLATEAAEAAGGVPTAVAELDERLLHRTQTALSALPVAVVRTEAG